MFYHRSKKRYFSKIIRIIGRLGAKTSQLHFLITMTFRVDLTYQTFHVFRYKKRTVPNKVMYTFQQLRKIFRIIYLAKQFLVNTVKKKMLIFASISSMEDAKSVYLFNDSPPFDIYFVLFTKYLLMLFDVNFMKEKIIFSYYFVQR